MSEREFEYWAVMFNHDGHISLTPSDGKYTPFGTKVRPQEERRARRRC